MKKTISVSIIVLLVLAMLLLGCAAPKGGLPEEKKDPYSGFMDLKAGQWAETVLVTSQGRVNLRTEVIENSPDMVKYQIQTGETEISQIWYDKQKERAAMYIVKSGGDVWCMDASDAPMSYVGSDDDAYPADKPGIGQGVYTTGAGDMVRVAKFHGENNEVWVSSEVPFGIVKMVVGGKTTMQLYDFGTIGAKNLIDPADLEKCEEPLIVDGYVSEEVYGSWQDDEDFLAADDYDYEAYIEDEIASEESDISARTYDPSGDEAEFDCSECDAMPPMAKNACLAACR